MGDTTSNFTMYSTQSEQELHLQTPLAHGTAFFHNAIHSAPNFSMDCSITFGENCIQGHGMMHQTYQSNNHVTCPGNIHRAPSIHQDSMNSIVKTYGFHNTPSQDFSMFTPQHFITNPTNKPIDLASEIYLQAAPTTRTQSGPITPSVLDTCNTIGTQVVQGKFQRSSRVTMYANVLRYQHHSLRRC
jgi:hypothetical protein